MQVVLLAAGLGSRLGRLTEGAPKALVTVGGEPLVCHAVRFARRLDPSEIVVVGGSGFVALRAEIERRALPVTLVENPSFRDGNLVSLFAARPRLTGELLLMNVDHIYRPPIAVLVARPVSEVTAFVDVDRSLGLDDMKVERNGSGRLQRISKTLDRFDAGYVGMTRVPRRAAARYWAAADAVAAEEGKAAHVERVLARLASSEPLPDCRDVSGFGWLEIDFAEERDRAEAALRGGGWA